jgi:hypothetical protein
VQLLVLQKIHHNFLQLFLRIQTKLTTLILMAADRLQAHDDILNTCARFFRLRSVQVEDEIIDAMLRATDRDGDGQISIKVHATCDASYPLR